MTTIDKVRARPGELLKRMPAVFRAAAAEGVTPSALLEIEDPSSEWGGERSDERTDAFGRLCRAGGIVRQNRPAIGQRSTLVGDLLHGEHEMPNGEKIGIDNGRAVLLTFTDRELRSTKYGESPNTRAMFLADDEVVGTPQRPWQDRPGYRGRNFTPQLPLGRFIAEETQITGTSYRAAYVDDIRPADAYTYVRIGEGSEIPTLKIRTRATDMRLHKYGIALDWTYEAEREMTLDKLALTLRKIELSQEEAKVGHVLYIIISGIPNEPATASPVRNLSSFAPAANGVLDLKSWLGFKRSLPNNYSPDLLIGGSEAITRVEMMPINVGTQAVPFIALQGTAGLGTITPVQSDRPIDNGIEYGVHDASPANTLLLLDTNFLIERVSQIGAMVNEATDFITNQTRVMTFTETEAYTKMWDDASVLLNLAA